MKLSYLLESWRVIAAAPLIEALRQAENIDEALGRFAASVQSLLDGPDFAPIKRSLVCALKHRFSADEVSELIRRMALCLPEMLALIHAFQEAQRLSDQEREKLAQEYYPLALSFLERHGVNEPSDVAAPVFVEVLNKYRPSRGQFRTLLFWLLRRRAAGWFRARTRRPVCEPLADHFDAPAPAETPYTDREALEAALTKGWGLLSQIDQRLFWLHHVVDFSFPEMAAQSDFIGCCLHQTAMRSRVSRALTKLRPFLLPFRGITHHELIEAVHRVARAAGTLSVQPARPRSAVRAARRRAAARTRCAKRRVSRGGK